MKRSEVCVLIAACCALMAFGMVQERAQEAEKPAAALRLSIAEAEALAEKNADPVRARSAALDAALGAARSAKASFYPSVSASASGAFLVNPPAGLTVSKGALGSIPLPPPTGPIPLPSQNLVIIQNAENMYYQGNITFKQPIVAWGKIRAAVDIADLEVQTAMVAQDGARLDAVREANRAYYSAKLALESEGILTELRALAASIVTDRQTSLDEGLGTREKVLSAQADLADIDAKIVDAQESAASGLESLSSLTGLPLGTKIVPSSDYRSTLPALVEDRVEAAALASATGSKSAAVMLKEASRKIDLARASSLFLPNLAFFASLDASGPRSTWSDTWSWDLSLGLSASVDLFDGGAARAKIQEARAGRDAAAAALHGAQNEVRLAARRTIQAARTAQAALIRAEAREAWAAEALKNARSAMQNDLTSRQELNAAAIQEAGARLDLLSARYSLEESLADLERLAPGDIG
jgi:outer membrane protein TolC